MIQKYNDNRQLEQLKTPAHSIEAEQMLISCIFLQGEIFEDVILTLQDKHFYRNAHKIIFQAMMSAKKENKAIDPIVIIGLLTQTQSLDMVGGVEYIHALAQISNAIINYKTYIEIIYECYVMREMNMIGNQIVEISYIKNDINIYDTISLYANKLTAIMSDNKTKKDFCDKNKMIQNVINMSENVETRKKKTHIKIIDEALNGGFREGNIVIIAGRPGMGKSLLAIDMFINMSKTNKCIFFSLEMTENEVTERIFLNITGKKPRQLTRGMMEDFEGELSQLQNMCIVDESRMTLKNLENYIFNYIHKNQGLDVIFIDYLQLMNNDQKIHKNDFISYAADELKILAKKYNIVIVALSQFTKEDNIRKNQANRRPDVQDLMGSSSIHNNADIIFLLHCERFYWDNIAKGSPTPHAIEKVLEINCAKYRQGKSFQAIVNIDRETMKIKPISEREEREYSECIEQILKQDRYK